MDLLQSLVAAGLGGSLIAAVITLVRIAIGAERRRADDWRDAAKTSAEANRIMSTNIDKLINTVEQLANSQREMMGLLQKVAADRGPT